MTHVDDGTLVRLLDGETVPEAAARHVATCRQCTRRREELVGQTGELREGLDHLLIGAPRWEPDFLERIRVPGAGDAPRRPGGWFRPRRLLAAAAVLAVLLVVPGARAWLLDGVTSLLEPFRTDAAAPAAPAVPPGGDGTPTEVSAVVEGERLVLEVVGTEGPDRLTVRRSGRELVTARLLPGGARGEILVLPGGFRVRGAGDARDLDVAVPPTVRVVEVRREERLLAELVLEEGVEGPWTLALDGDG